MTCTMHRVLMVEGHPGMRAAMRTLLTTAGYRFVAAETAARGEIDARTHRPDLVIVNLELPDCSGIELIGRVRAQSAVPVLALSLHAIDTQNVAALDAGADDYVIWPCGAPELLARMRAILRRTAAGPLRSWEIRLGKCVIDLARRELCSAAGKIHLTPLEFRVLENLARQAGGTIEPDSLVRQVWGAARSGDTRSLRVCIRNLRAKLEPDVQQPRYLVTERGFGYRLRFENVAG